MSTLKHFYIIQSMFAWESFKDDTSRVTSFKDKRSKNVAMASEYPAKSLDKHCLFFNKAIKKWPILVKTVHKKAKNGNFLTKKRQIE